MSFKFTILMQLQQVEFLNRPQAPISTPVQHSNEKWQQVNQSCCYICSISKSHNGRFAVVGTIVNFLLTGTLLVLIQVRSLSEQKQSYNRLGQKTQ